MGARSALLGAAFVRLLLVQLSVGCSFSIYLLLPKYLATEHHANASVIGVVGAMGLIAAVVATPFVGHALDRVGRRPMMILSGVLQALASLGMAGIDEVGPALYGLRLLQGTAVTLALNATAVSVADIAPPGRLGHALGLLGGASLFANALAPPAAEAVAHALGWRAVFLGATAVALCTAGLGLTVTDAPRRQADLSGPPPSGMGRVLYAALITGAAFGTMFTFTQPFALDLGATRVAGFFTGFAISGLSIRLVLGNAADRWGRLPVARAALFGYGLLTLLTAFLRPNLLELYGLGLGIAHGFLYPSLGALIAERSSAAWVGRALSTFNGAFNLGIGVAMLGCGSLATHAGYPAVFLLVGACTALSTLALFGVPVRARPA